MDKKKTKNKNHNKKKYAASNQLVKFRGWIQAGATLLTNIHLPNFFKGEIYQGKGKAVCVPGLTAIPVLPHRVLAQSAHFRR